MQLGLAIESTPADLVDVRRGPASAAVSGLAPGRRVVGMTMGQFSMLDLVIAVLEHTGPAHLSLSTWTAGIRDATQAGLLLDSGRLLSVRLLVDRSFASRQPRYCAAVQRIFGDDAIRCTRTHAKIATINNDDWSVSIRSSMNLNRNPRFEQFDIDTDPRIAQFFCAHFDEMAGEMPDGPRVSTAEVDAVFGRLARGINPFSAPPADILASSGAPIPGPDLVAWVRERAMLSRVAKRCGVKCSALRAALIEGEPLDLVEDAVYAALQIAGNCDERGA